MMKFLVKGQRIEIVEREVIASGLIAFVTLKFAFDQSWRTLHKVVQFAQDDEHFHRVLGVDGLSCFLPSELHAGAVRMTVVGYDSEADTTVRATAVPVTLHIRPSGFCAEDVAATPDMYAQLLAEFEKMGIPFPPVIKKAIDVLQTKVGRAEEKLEEEDKNGNSEG